MGTATVPVPLIVGGATDHFPTNDAKVLRYVTTSRADAERTVCDFGRCDWSTWAMQAGTCRVLDQVGHVLSCTETTEQGRCARDPDGQVLAGL